jgi:hypothetical protein
VLTDRPLAAADTSAVWFALNDPADAVNVALLEPLATDTLAGTLTTVLPLVRATESAALALPVKEILQELELFGASVVGVQDKDESWTDAGGTSAIDADLLTPLAVAVITAVPLALMLAAVALNVNAVEPEAIDTLAGILKRLLLDAREIVVVDTAALVNVIVHEDTIPEPRVVGLQENPDSWGAAWAMVIVPFVAETGMVLPSAVAAKSPVNWIGTLEWLGADARWTVRPAMVPVEIIPKLSPDATQVVLEPVLLQLIVLPAEAKAELAVTDMLEMSADE